MSKTSIPMKADIHFLDDEELVNQCLTNYNSSSQNNKNNIFGLQWNWDYRFHIIFVPSFDDIKKKHPSMFGKNINHYPQLNRILALYIIYHCTDYNNINKFDYMIMLDPDCIFLKSLEIDELETKFGLNLHHPIAAKYGLGNKWARWLRENGETNINIASEESKKYYEGGVPYILHNTDWYNLIPKWISYVSFAYSKYKGIESDMYSYMISSYKLGLKHSLSEHFMNTCMGSKDQKTHPFDKNNVFLHYCTSYKLNISKFPQCKTMVEKIGDNIYTFNKHWTKARKNKKTKMQQL